MFYCEQVNVVLLAAAASGSVQPGGRCFHLPGLLFGFSATRSLRSALDFLLRGPWISSAVTPRPGLCSQPCEPGGVEERGEPRVSCCLESGAAGTCPGRRELLRRGAPWRLELQSETEHIQRDSQHSICRLCEINWVVLRLEKRAHGVFLHLNFYLCSPRPT